MWLPEPVSDDRPRHGSICPVERDLDAVDGDIGDIVVRKPYGERRRRALLIDAPEKTSNRGRAQLHRVQRVANGAFGLRTQAAREEQTCQLVDFRLAPSAIGCSRCSGHMDRSLDA